MRREFRKVSELIMWLLEHVVGVCCWIMLMEHEMRWRVYRYDFVREKFTGGFSTHRPLFGQRSWTKVELPRLHPMGIFRRVLLVHLHLVRGIGA